MPVWLKVAASIALVAAVLWWMWRRPVRESLYPWAPPLALASAWLGLLAAIFSAGLWFLPYPDRWLVVVLLLLDPGASASGVLTFWLLRDISHDDQGAQAQRLQATVGLVLVLIAITLGYIFVMTHKTPFTPVGP